jgi:hypothetical protein
MWAHHPLTLETALPPRRRPDARCEQVNLFFDKPIVHYREDVRRLGPDPLNVEYDLA